MSMAPTFNLRPSVPVRGHHNCCWDGWESIVDQLGVACQRVGASRVILAIECYPGVDEGTICAELETQLRPRAILRSKAAFKPAEDVQRMVAPYLTNDPVFGRLTSLLLDDFLDPGRQAEFQERLSTLANGLVVVCGVGSTLLCRSDVLVYCDLPRREAQLRFRRDLSSNLGVDNRSAPWPEQYKRGYFVDWRVADEYKQRIFKQSDYLLDTTNSQHPKLATGSAVRDALRQTAHRPFSVVPYFDPAPWGGHWMQQTFGLDREAPNFGWCFNCVPEENSLLLDFGGRMLELPAIDLVFFQPLELLGPDVYQRYGAEFPIRFDFLDTVGGGNLSLQVHPTADYIRDTFGMPYTQDESYYFLQAKPNGSVYLGVKDGIEPRQMFRELRSAQDGLEAFVVDRFVNRFSAKKHDHYHIPAGTVHCQGVDAVVLEISATPYIFTFKLWDWDRLGLDGKPRPIHLDHGERVIDWTKSTRWVGDNLVNTVTPVSSGHGWREERTGLYPSEPLETRRHWFTRAVPHNTENTLNVLCLVDGIEAVVESPSDAFAPFVVHYAEAFVVPASIGDYIIRPHGPGEGTECVTVKAFVRPCRQ